MKKTDKAAQYVIIGNGVASIGAIEAIRKRDKEGKITVITDEKYPCYGRPLISYYLEGMTTRDKMDYRPAGFYSAMNVDLVLGERVDKIDAKAHKVMCGNKSYPYDKLLIATGSSPVVPPTEGYDNVRKKFTFNKLDDALAIEKAVDKSSRVLIIGAGLTGLKAAEGLYPRVGSITVVDMADRVLPAVMDADASAIIRKYLEGKGIKFYLSDCVSSYGDGFATLRSGAEIDFDVLVTAVGVRPNTALAAEIGCAVERMTESGRPFRGIVVGDDQMTNVKDVYAAGDCTLSYDVTFGNTRPLFIQPNAYMQGETAGTFMSGGSREKRNYLPVNAGGFLGLHIITAGSYDGEPLTIEENGSFHRFFVKDGKLRGFIQIGGYSRVGILTDMIRRQTDIESVDFASLVRNPGLAALGMDYVHSVLGKEGA